MKKFTDTFLRSLKPGAQVDIDILEGHGFGVRIRKSGALSFFYKYRFEGKLRFMTLGVYPHMTLADARERHAAALKVRKNGLDPIVEAEKEKQKERASEWETKTVKDFCLEYIEYLKNEKKKKAWHKDELTLKADIIPAWGKRKVGEISGIDAVELLEKVRKRAPGQAQNVLESCRAMWNWVVIKKKRLSFNPFAGIERQTPLAPGGPHLKEGEIKKWWRCLNGAEMSDEIKRALKLTLLTAQRPGEVISVRYEEITKEATGWWWTIPSDKAKNEHEHRVYLTDTARRLIGDIEGKKGYVFPCPHKKKNKSMSEGAMGYALRRAYASSQIAGVTQVSPHDLRRTGITHFARLRIKKEWRERTVNHEKETLDRLYNQYEYDREKRVTLGRWEDELLRLLNELNLQSPEQDDREPVTIL